ncbi:hypothetical protein CH380_05820 [Leptospira adleri]|uniref:Uncharacterized protein n=1 Tax=Leptospira adleri TaxID=2023186 RepID=A0A2M9YR82_9LEPT|nr:hypothetical protein CH380_05820 [Leptospira adleri]PJZ63360.1 hypothetical protein CH376_03740 [Leptospira adleri]
MRMLWKSFSFCLRYWIHRFIRKRRSSYFYERGILNLAASGEPKTGIRARFRPNSKTRLERISFLRTSILPSHF